MSVRRWASSRAGLACLALLAMALPSALGQTMPEQRRLSAIRNLLETRQVWVVFEGDSFAVVGAASNRLPSATYSIGLWNVGPRDVTAWQIQHAGGGEPPTLCHVPNGLLGTPQLDYRSQYLMDGLARWTIPCVLGQAVMDGQGDLGPSGAIMSFWHRADTFADAVPGPLWEPGASEGLGVRLLYYASARQLNTRRIRRHDLLTEADGYVDTVALDADARGLWHLGEKPHTRPDGAPIPGQINAIYPDIMLSNTQDGSHAIALFDAWSWPFGGPDPGGDAHTIFSPIWYRARSRENDVPAWERGHQLTVLADSSWSSYGFSEGRAPNFEYAKTHTPAMLRHFLDVSCLSRSLTPLFVLYVALDEIEETGYPAPGDMSDPLVLESIYRNYIAMREEACASVGLPAPYFLLLMPHYHEADGPIGDGTPEEARALVGAVASAMDTVAESHGRTAYFSIMADTDGILFDGNPDARAWLEAHDYDAWSPGGGYDTIDLTDPDGQNAVLLDELGLHPIDATSALFFADRLKRAVVQSDAPCPGDFDGNERTDVFDFFTLAVNFGSSGLGVLVGGDMDADDDVDVFDFNDFAPAVGCGN